MEGGMLSSSARAFRDFRDVPCNLLDGTPVDLLSRRLASAGPAAPLPRQHHRQSAARWRERVCWGRTGDGRLLRMV